MILFFLRKGIDKLVYSVILEIEQLKQENNNDRVIADTEMRRI